MTAYEQLEDRVISRDQVGAARVYYDLVKAGRPVPEMLGEMVRIHAPYTHVPYHQRLDGGVPRFVNNDHCLLSARASWRLMDRVSPDLRYLPLAQTVWYIPTGLDPWNQLLGKAPGHYVRLYKIEAENVVAPEVHWPDQEPEYLEGPFPELLNEWLSLVQRGEVLRQYRVFLGLLDDVPNRTRLLAQLAFAGLIDVQDRMLFNRSYTTGHKAHRARATIELGGLLGWENAHAVAYAGVPDIAVGPRWYSTYEMACNVVQAAFEGKDHDLLSNKKPLTHREIASTFDVLMHSREPVWTDHVTALLKAGRGPRQILDVLQMVSAEVVLQTHDSNLFSMPQHCAEYLNTLRWFYDSFDHPHQIKLLYVAAAFVNQAAHHQASIPGNGPKRLRPPRGASSMSQPQLLEQIEKAMLSLNPDESVTLTDAYLKASYNRDALIEVLLNAGAKLGNDPHNQEISLALVENYLFNGAAGRERLLLAAAKHNAGHRKYGDPFESYRRFAEACLN